MQEPDVILANGTKVVTCDRLDSTSGMFVAPRHLAARRASAKGVIQGIVGGHGGDVYWVKHEDGAVAAYGWMDFELEPVDAPTVWDRVQGDET